MKCALPLPIELRSVPLKRMIGVWLLWLLMAGAAAAQQTLAPGENLVAQGIPALPAALAEEVGRYTEFRSASLASWHPTRREALISTRFGDTTQIHRVDAPGGARCQLTFFRDSVGGASYQPTQGDYFVFSKDTGGNEFTQNYRYDLANGKVTLLTDGKSRNSRGIWSNKGDQMAYTSTRRNGRENDFYVIDPSRPESDRLVCAVEGNGWGILDWSPDDKTLLALQYLSANESTLYRIDVASGSKTPLIMKEVPPGRGVSWGGGKFARDGKGVYTTTDAGSEFGQLVYVELATGKRTPLSEHIPWDVTGFELSPDGKTLAFLSNEDGLGRLHLLDTTTGKEISLPGKLPPGSVGGVEWHRNGQDLGFVVTSVRTPADMYSLEVKTGKVDRWTRSETGGLVTDSWTEPERVQWKSFDERMISGYLYRPPAERFPGKRPVVINIHGGPEGQYRPGFPGRSAYYLQEMGVALLYPNIRGSSGYGKTFLKLDNGQQREDAYRDIETLLDWIKTRPDLDANRIMVTGGSYGGHMTLALATRYPDRIACSLSSVGISNFVTFLQNTEAYRRDLRRAEYGDERDPKMREYFERTAPVNNASKITRPLFVVQGKNDPRVPYTEAEQMVTTVKKNGTPVWYLLANDEGHGFRKKENIDFLFYSTVLFVREYLLK